MSDLILPRWYRLVAGALGATVVGVIVVLTVAVGSAVAQPDAGATLTVVINGPGGERDATITLDDDGAGAHDFPIDAYGSYEWQIRDESGDIVAQGIISVDEIEQPCSTDGLDVGASCAGVTHRPLDGSPSYITIATRQPVTTATTTTTTTGTSVAAPPTTASATDDAGSSSNLWILVLIVGLLLLLGGLAFFFGSSPSDDDEKTPTPTAPPSSTPPKAKPPSCRIEVEATRISGLQGEVAGFKIGLPVYHLCVVYYDQNGKATYFRGGPTKRGGKAGYGFVSGKSGPHVPGAVDWAPGCPRLVVAEGPAACGKDKLMAAELARINAMKVAYAPKGPNSNTTARRLLKAAGATEAKPVWVAPGWDDPGLDPKPTPPADSGGSGS